MTKYLATVAALAVGLTAVHAQPRTPAKSPGTLYVFDEAKLFTEAGVEQAKAKLRATEFDHGLEVTVDTYADQPPDRKAAADAAKGDPAKWRAFMLDWARHAAKDDKAKGVYVLVTTHPVGGVAVIADRQTTDRGFTQADDEKVRLMLTSAFKEAKGETDPAKQHEIRSAALVKVMEYIASDLKDTRVPAGSVAGDHGRGPVQTNAPPRSPIMGYVCLGLFVLAGVWLVIGLIRMFTGGGGAAGAGGGGFMSSLFGGMFGAAAGMWLYSSMFGGGGMFGGGSDAYAGDAGTGGDAGGADTGAGDWGGGSGDAGGFDGGGDVGGGDFGGDF